MKVNLPLSKCGKRKKNKMFIINFCLNMFRASLCPSSGEQRPCVTAQGALRWFCWMWLVAVVGRCVLGCEQCPFELSQRIKNSISHAGGTLLVAQLIEALRYKPERSRVRFLIVSLKFFID